MPERNDEVCLKCPAALACLGGAPGQPYDCQLCGRWFFMCADTSGPSYPDSPEWRYIRDIPKECKMVRNGSPYQMVCFWCEQKFRVQQHTERIITGGLY